MPRDKPFSFQAGYDSQRYVNLKLADIDRYAASGRALAFAPTLISIQGGTTPRPDTVTGTGFYLRQNNFVTFWFTFFPTAAFVNNSGVSDAWVATLPVDRNIPASVAGIYNIGSAMVETGSSSGDLVPISIDTINANRMIFGRSNNGFSSLNKSYPVAWTASGFIRGSVSYHGVTGYNL